MARAAARMAVWLACGLHGPAFATSTSTEAAPDVVGPESRALPGDTPLDGGRLREFALQLDNDSLATWPHDDRWYTSGLLLHWVHEAGDAGVHARIAAAWCAAAGCGDGARAFRLTSLAHRIYNPADNTRTDPQPLDRPYAGLLSIGTGVLIREPDAIGRLEARLGLLGPAALGEQVQNGVHRALGLGEAQGWTWQLRPRTELQLGWARIVRHGGPDARLDWVHRFSVGAGTLRGVASAGAQLRWGALPDAPTWPGEPGAPWGTHGGRGGSGYLYAGVDVRAVAWDRLIDGPAFGYLSEVDARPFDADAFAGASLRLTADWRIDFAMTVRTRQFDTPQRTYRGTRFGTLLLRWSGS